MRALLPTLVLASCLGAGPLLAQVTTTLTLTPGANGIQATMISPTGGIPFTSPPRIAQWTGTITVQLDDAFHPTTLTIVSASLVAPSSGSYTPAVGGQTLGPPAPASYSLAGGNGYPLITAFRDTQGSLAGGPIALAGSGGAFSFAPGATAFGLSTAIDWQYSSLPGGRNGLHSSLPNLASASGSLTTDGATLSLLLPTDATFHMDFPYPSQPTRAADYHFFGTFTATGVIPEPSTVAIALVGAGLLGLVARRRGV